MTEHKRHDLRLRALRVLGIPVRRLIDTWPTGAEECAVADDVNPDVVMFCNNGHSYIWKPDLDIAQAIRVAETITGLPSAWWIQREGDHYVAGIVDDKFGNATTPAEALLRAALAAGEMT